MATRREPERPQQTILVTGANGFIGQRLTARLAEDGLLQVRAFARRPPVHQIPNVEWIEGDLLAPATYVEHLEGVDVVIHLAAAVGRCQKSQYFATNYHATNQLLAHCREAGVARLLFVSTIAVRFSGLDAYPYAESKRRAEELVRQGGIPYQIIRPTIVLGPRSPNWESLVKLATMPVTPIFGPGTNSVQPIDVDDLVTCLATLTRHPTDEEVIELGGRDIVTMNEFLRRIHRRNSARRFRPWHLPLKQIQAVVGGLERIAGHRLPLSRGQLSVFGNDSTVMPSRFHEAQRERMRSLDQIIARASSAVTQGIDDSTSQHHECVTFSNYLVGRYPATGVRHGYVRAHEQGVLEENLASPWDRRIVALARRHTWLCLGIDSYCRFFSPQALLRRKLVLLLALWECEPTSGEDFQLEHPVPAVWIGVRIAGRLLLCVMITCISASLLIPLKLLTPKQAIRREQGG